MFMVPVVMVVVVIMRVPVGVAMAVVVPMGVVMVVPRAGAVTEFLDDRGLDAHGALHL